MELLAGNDQTGEVDASSLIKETAPVFTVDSTLLSDCNVYIVTVPTPVDDFKTPNLEALFAASELIGGNLHDGNVVVFESTVFPGVTEDLCGPILCRESGLKPAVTDEGDVPCFTLAIAQRELILAIENGLWIKF